MGVTPSSVNHMGPFTLTLVAVVGVAGAWQWRWLNSNLQQQHHRGLTEYRLPKWVPKKKLEVWPSRRVELAHLPTPIHEWRGLKKPEGVIVDVKRDDYSGSELSGNKVRKLEFLLADALSKGATKIVTVGGIQSNHCRATAAACRRLGLEPHLILRASDAVFRNGLDRYGLRGNVLIDRLVGAHISLIPDSEFTDGAALVEEKVTELGVLGYGFPSGGSNALGTYGYLEAVREMLDQGLNTYDRVYFACGSGGTAAGLALGFRLSGARPELVGLCVDDDPQFFYDKIDTIFQQIGPALHLPPSSTFLRLEDAVGDGYALSTDDELRFIADVAANSGVVLDPVYSGKAARAMLIDLKRSPPPTKNKLARVLFIHTGGLLGLYGGPGDRLLHVLNSSPSPT